MLALRWRCCHRQQEATPSGDGRQRALALGKRTQSRGHSLASRVERVKDLASSPAKAAVTWPIRLIGLRTEKAVASSDGNA